MAWCAVLENIYNIWTMHRTFIWLRLMLLSMASEILYSLHGIFTKDAVLVIFAYSVDRFRLRISLVNSRVDQTWRPMEIWTGQQRNFNESSKRWTWAFHFHTNEWIDRERRRKKVTWEQSGLCERFGCVIVMFTEVIRHWRIWHNAQWMQ